MLKLRYLVWITSTGLMALGVGLVSGQNYPNKPIRMVTSEVGGTADFTARAIAPELTNNLGQQVIVENRGGIASIRTMIVIKAPPDGYTVLLSGNVRCLRQLRYAVCRKCARLAAPLGEEALVAACCSCCGTAF